jgi:hypothetical protein
VFALAGSLQNKNNRTTALNQKQAALTAKVAAMTEDQRYARAIELADSDFNGEHLDEFVKCLFGPEFELTK